MTGTSIRAVEPRSSSTWTLGELLHQVRQVLDRKEESPG